MYTIPDPLKSGKTVANIADSLIIESPEYNSMNDYDSFNTDTVSVIVQCALRSTGLLMELLNYTTSVIT
jgi:hypothetical protein